MWHAVLWGSIAGSASLIGSMVVMIFSVKRRFIGLIMALGTGALIGVTVSQLLVEAVEMGGLIKTAFGFLGGALLFTMMDYVVSAKGGHKRKHSKGRSAVSGVGLAIFLGTIMDAIPESAMIGVSFTNSQMVSWSLVIAIFISNFPEGLSSTVGLQKDGYSKSKIIVMWVAVLIFSAVSSFVGYTVLGDASEGIKSLITAFAGGGIIAMVASTMMPEAFEEGGPAVGFMTAFGIFIILLLDHL